MAERIPIAIDTLGGDNGPVYFVRGAIEGLKQNKNVKLFLVGNAEELESLLAEYEDYDKDRIEIVPSTEVIGCDEPPVEAIRKKKDSSLAVGLRLVKEGKAKALISAGSSGAVLAGGQFIVGRAKGVKRAPLVMPIPTTEGHSLLLDCGANVDAKPEVLRQFAVMGSIYMENLLGVENPSVGLVNIGAEDEKGNALVKATLPLLRECPNINFAGSIEARDIPFGKTDVVLAEAFTGNVIIKLYEGLSKMILSELKNACMKGPKEKLGGLLIKKSLKSTVAAFDASDKGGAPLLGLKGLVVKIHGNSKNGEVRSAIRQCRHYVQSGVSEKIRIGLEENEI